MTNEHYCLSPNYHYPEIPATKLAPSNNTPACLRLPGSQERGNLQYFFQKLYFMDVTRLRLKMVICVIQIKVVTDVLCCCVLHTKQIRNM